MEGIQILKKNDKNYPERLKYLEGMPEQLYCVGKMPDDHRPTVAIVGARRCSPYGRIQAFKYAKFLSEAGVQIVTGMAVGIDGSANEGALEGETETFAVLGNGPDICYPSSHKGLYDRIIRTGGGIISEYAPGVRAQPWHFPLRNRIISGLSDLVIVVEAKDKSGSLITAGYALEQGKTVYAVPGPVNEELSRGCNKLIYDGAGIAYSPEILLEELGIFSKNNGERQGKRKIVLAREMKLLYSCLDLRPKSLDELSAETGINITQISHMMIEMELMGIIQEVGKQRYIKNEIDSVVQ